MTAIDAHPRRSEFAGFEAGAWLFVRLVLSVEWVRGGLEKVGQAGWTEPPVGRSVSGFLKGAIAKSTEGAHPEVPHWYHQLAEQVLLPNAEVFGILVSYGEVLVGVALLLGFLTRIAALGGVTMNLAFLWAGTTSTNPPMLLLGVALVLFGSEAGRFGLDYWVIPRAAEWLPRGVARTLPAITLGLTVIAACALALAVTDTATWAGLLAFSLIATIGATWRHRSL